MAVRLFFIFMFISVFGQSMSPLTKRISVDFKNLKLETALDEIQALGRFYFSYNSKVIDRDKSITYSSFNESVESVLDNILGEGFTYKHRGKYIIIQKSETILIKKKKVVVSGKVASAKDSTKISDVTIYEIDKLKSTSTNKEGDFNLTVSSKKEEVSVLVSKENYKDTILSFSEFSDTNLSIYLEPDADTAKWKKFLKIDSIPWLRMFYTKNILNTIRNVELTENRKFQFSLVPFVGTNRKLSGKITNNYSLNLIGGYAYGLNGLEVGGVLNILKDTMRGAQISGFGNIVGGKVSGVQIAGAVNYCHDTVKGLQIAGATNVTTKSMEGIQVGGACNISSVINRGGQIGGAFNYSREINKGFQISGAVNVNKETLRGTQIAGLLNYTKTLSGLQVAPFNFCDSVSGGIPIGLFSHVKSGFHNVEISYSDYLSSGISYRTGVHKFYNILSLDYYHQESDPLVSYGYGIGSQFNFTKKTFSNIELSARQILSLNKFSESFNQLNILAKFNLNIGYRFGKDFSLLGGPELNFYISDNLSTVSEYDNFTKRKALYTNNTQSTFLDIRLGYRVALRF